MLPALCTRASILVGFVVIFTIFSGDVPAQCLADPVDTAALQFDIDLLFSGLDRSLGTSYPPWLSRYQQENSTDPTPLFGNEDNCQNGLDDDDHIELLSAILYGEPAATVLPGILPANVSDIRASFTSNRAKVKPDLTLTIIFVTVNIIEEIEKGDPAFGAALQDLVAAYMTIGDAESVKFIRGLLITLGDIFIEEGVASGAIPGGSFVGGLTKNALRSAVNGNFVASRYACFGDAPGAVKPNLLGKSGNIGGSANNNRAEYELQGRNRQAWLQAKGVALPPLEITPFPANLSTSSGKAAAWSVTVLGGTGASIQYDWKKVESGTGLSQQTGTEPTLAFPYPVPDQAGRYALYVCDGTWIRSTVSARLQVEEGPFEIVSQPAGADKLTGESHAFSVRAEGGIAIPGYQWYRGPALDSLSPILGATDRELILDDLGLEDSGVYQVWVTGAVSEKQAVTLFSDIVALHVALPPDVEAPVITLPGANPLVLECGGTYIEPGAAAQDDRDGDVSGLIEITGVVDMLEPGSYTRVYRVSDAAGNTAEVSREVIVRDIQSPELTLLGTNPMILECGTLFTEPGALALDVCAGDISGLVLMSGSVDTATPGDYLRTYTVSDPSENSAQVTRVVRVVDQQAPILSLLGPETISIECGAFFIDPGATALDVCDGDLGGSILISGMVDPSTPGEYTLTYTLSDAAGNQAQTSRLVLVADSTPPELTLHGANPLVLECNTPYNEPGASATDVCDGVLSDAVTITGTVDHRTPGEYTVRYAVEDQHGNRAEAERTVIVRDETPPELTLLGAARIVLFCNQVYTEPGWQAFDTCDGILGASVSVTGDVLHGTPGIYELTYTVRDASGNTATASRTVEILDDCFITINSQPRSQTVYEGGNVIFQVAVSGGVAALSYDWRKDGISLGAPSQPVLSLSTVTFDSAGLYTCIIRDGVNSIESVGALLSVVARPESGQQSADTDGDWFISLSELLRIIQFYNFFEFACAGEQTEDGYQPGQGDRSCPPHNSDYNPQDWQIDLSELLRLIQFYNSNGYHPCEEGEDGFCPGPSVE